MLHIPTAGILVSEPQSSTASTEQEKGAKAFNVVSMSLYILCAPAESVLVQGDGLSTMDEQVEGMNA